MSELTQKRWSGLAHAVTGMMVWVALTLEPVRAQGWTPPGGVGGGEPVSDLRFGPVDPAVLEARGEDLRIMGRVLERAVRPSGREAVPGVRMGIPLWVSGGHEGVKATYLEGFGALFTLSVDMPLTPSRTAGPESRGGAAESAWDAARREVQGDGGEVGGEDSGAVHDPVRLVRWKEQVLAALRQATNLRHLAAGEWVAVVLEGPGGGAGEDEAGSGAEGSAGAVGGGSAVVTGGNTFLLGSHAGSGKGSVALFESGTSGGTRTGSRSFRWSVGRPGSMGVSTSGGFGFDAVGPAGGVSRLVFRVRRADLDALAAGTLGAEAWAERVGVYAYDVPAGRDVMGSRF